LDIPQLDRSNYLKGLLITARRDNQLAESEITIIKKLAARLGFSSDFFEETISHLLENKYITEEPIKFSNQEIAKSFSNPLKHNTIIIINCLIRDGFNPRVTNGLILRFSENINEFLRHLQLLG
jgi:hypothetical protein